MIIGMKKKKKERLTFLGPFSTPLVLFFSRRVFTLIGFPGWHAVL